MISALIFCHWDIVALVCFDIGRSYLHRKRRLPPTLESKDSGIDFHGLLSLVHKLFTQTIFHVLSNDVQFNILSPPRSHVLYSCSPICSQIYGYRCRAL